MARAVFRLRSLTLDIPGQMLDKIVVLAEEECVLHSIKAASLVQDRTSDPGNLSRPQQDVYRNAVMLHDVDYFIVRTVL